MIRHANNPNRNHDFRFVQWAQLSLSSTSSNFKNHFTSNFGMRHDKINLAVDFGEFFLKIGEIFQGWALTFKFWTLSSFKSSKNNFYLYKLFKKSTKTVNSHFICNFFFCIHVTSPLTQLRNKKGLILYIFMNFSSKSDSMMPIHLGNVWKLPR